MKEQLTPGNKPNFKDFEPIKLWSAQITTNVSYSEFERVTKKLSKSSGISITGFLTKDNNGKVTSFTGTRYPRIKYGVTPIEDCESIMNTLASELSGEITIQKKTGCRVVMGLMEGYDDQATKHDAKEVANLLPYADITSAQVFAVRNTDEGISVYTEPVAIIEANGEYLEDVYLIGDKLKQERFTVENFDSGLANIVETRYCTEPD